MRVHFLEETFKKAVTHLVHVVPCSEASPNVTVLHKGQQLRTDYRDFLLYLELSALVTGQASEGHWQYFMA